MEYKEGTHVKIKDGIELESGETTENWGGETVAYYPESDIYCIALDAPTLLSLSDNYLMDCISDLTEPYEYLFESSDLMPADRRDTKAERTEAMRKTEERMEQLESEMEDEGDDRDAFIGWIKEFEKSHFFEALTDSQKDDAFFIIESFYDYAINYAGVHPEDWDAYAVQEACGVAARKITAEMEVFENFVPVLDRFFEFLGEKQYMDNTQELREAAQEVAPRIIRIASDPSEWGMAKSMMMGAMEAGLDPSNEQDLQEYIARLNQQQLGSLPELGHEPTRKSELDKIGRNERITVRYEDGRVVENVKFKKVKEDLEDGRCTLVKKG